MGDAAAVPHTTGKNGYDWDAYSDPCQLVDIHTPLIPFHNYRQIHVSENAWFAGITAASIKEIPPCPPKWTDVAHYWNSVSLSGWLFYEYGLNSKGSFLIRVVEIVGSIGAVELAKKAIPMLAGMQL